MPTKAELKQQAAHIKLKIRKNDRVMIISGKDKGQSGFVAKVDPKTQRAIVLQEDPNNPDQLNPLQSTVKHRKARTNQEKSARERVARPIHISNLMVLDPKGDAPTRVGRRKEGDKIVRYAKKSGEHVPDNEVMDKE